MNSLLFLFTGIIVGGVAMHLYYKYSSFIGGHSEVFTEPTQINAVTANRFFKKYHRPFSVKLQTETDNGIEDIKTFIIRQSIIEHFASLILRENADRSKSPIKQVGLALTLGQNSNGNTLLVTALVCSAEGNRDDIKSSWHLLPRNETDINYIYDHLDLCPSTCPKNSVALNSREYYRSDPNRNPAYNSQINYWIRQ